MRGVVLNLGAQAGYVDHHRVLVHEAAAPDEVVEAAAREDAVDVVHEELHHRVLLAGEDYLVAVFVEAQRARVVAEGPGRHHVLERHPAAAAYERPRLRGEDDGVEGLHDIVVRAEVEAVELLVVLAVGRAYHDGRLYAAAAHVLDEAEAVYTGQVDVRHDEVVAHPPEPLEALLAARGRLRRERRGPQRPRQNRARDVVGVYYQYAVCQGPALPYKAEQILRLV